LTWKTMITTTRRLRSQKSTQGKLKTKKSLNLPNLKNQSIRKSGLNSAANFPLERLMKTSGWENNNGAWWMLTVTACFR
jgi:hypothetical protein